MKRREFLEKSFQAGLSAAVAVKLGGLSRTFAASTLFQSRPDLVAVKNGEPGAMFDKAIEAMGGMKSFVKKNQTVVIKPNIGWDAPVERAANTNPQLIGRIVQHCLNAGAKDVVVFDNTCDNWQRCYSNSGIERAVKDAGGKLAPGNSEGYYQEVPVKNGKRLTSAKVHELILGSDVFINVPILKNHGSSKLTISMKNLMGIVWDRRYWHRNDLHQCIADFATFRKPDLNVVDAYSVMKQNGPRGVSTADVVLMKSLLLSKDIVAADAAAAKLFGVDPATIAYIQYAHELNAGSKVIDKMNIKRISL
jgi:uncharacterized protein (DUF362 family)